MNLECLKKYRPYREGTETPPEKLGTYRIIKENLIFYIGISNNLKSRMKDHIRSGKCSKPDYFNYKVARPGTKYNEVREHEKRKILQYNPPGNSNGGGGGGRTPAEITYLKEYFNITD